MAISIYSNNGVKNYGIKHYIVDTDNDIQKMPTNCKPGSTAFSVESSKYFMLNNQRQWIEVHLNSSDFGIGGGSSGSNDGDDTIIFNGGSPVGG